MKKRNFRSLFAGRGGHHNKAKGAADETLPTIPGIKKLLDADRVNVENEVSKVEDEAKVQDEAKEEDDKAEMKDDEEWGEDAQDEERAGSLDCARYGPRMCDSYSFSSSVPTDASSKALRHCKTFDQSDASSFSLPSRRITDLYDPNDAKSIITSGIPSSLLRPRTQSAYTDDSYSVANSSVTTRASANVLFQAHTFDLSGASMFGVAAQEENDSASDTLGSSSEVDRPRRNSTDVSYQEAGMAHAFSHDVHSFFSSVFNARITEIEEEE